MLFCCVLYNVSVKMSPFYFWNNFCNNRVTTRLENLEMSGI